MQGSGESGSVNGQALASYGTWFQILAFLFNS